MLLFFSKTVRRNYKKLDLGDGFIYLATIFLLDCLLLFIAAGLAVVVVEIFKRNF